MHVDMNKIKELKQGYRNFGYNPSDLEVAADYWHSCLTNEEKVRILGAEAGRWTRTAMSKYRECINEIAEALIR